MKTGATMGYNGGGHSDLSAVARSEEEPYREPPSRRNKVVVIEPRNLFSQCLMTALRGLDKSTEFLLFQSVSEWRESSDSGSSCVVILCASSQGGGIDAEGVFDGDLAELKAHNPAVKFMIMSDREEPMSILKALDHGAYGYIPTSLSLEVVIQVLQLVRAGGIYVPASSLVALSNLTKAKSSSDEGEALFSSRQLAVAKALRKGMPNKVIAYELNMCESTVKIHVRNIMKKLKAKNRTEAALLTTQLFPDGSS